MEANLTASSVYCCEVEKFRPLLLWLLTQRFVDSDNNDLFSIGVAVQLLRQTKIDFAQTYLDFDLSQLFYLDGAP